MGNIPRSVAGAFALELDGVNCGFVKSAEGGEISAEVVTARSGDSPFARKQISRVNFEEFELALGLDLARSVYDWIAQTWSGKAPRRNGAVIELDERLDARSQRTFRDALITETTIPALDGSSKDAAFLTLKFAPESIESSSASGAARGAQKQKRFMASAFRLELDGLDSKRVSRIDAFTVKQRVSEDQIGDRRVATREPGAVEFPNLRVTLAETGSETWRAWFDDFVVKGNNDDSREKSGAIVFLDPTLKNELGRIELRNVGIVALRRKRRTNDEVPRLVAELYVETMTFDVKGVEAVQPQPSQPSQPDQPAQPVRPVRPIRPPTIIQPPGN